MPVFMRASSTQSVPMSDRDMRNLDVILRLAAGEISDLARPGAPDLTSPAAVSKFDGTLAKLATLPADGLDRTTAAISWAPSESSRLQHRRMSGSSPFGSLVVDISQLVAERLCQAFARRLMSAMSVQQLAASLLTPTHLHFNDRDQLVRVDTILGPTDNVFNAGYPGLIFGDWNIHSTDYSGDRTDPWSRTRMVTKGLEASYPLVAAGTCDRHPHGCELYFANNPTKATILAWWSRVLPDTDNHDGFGVQLDDVVLGYQTVEHFRGWLESQRPGLFAQLWQARHGRLLEQAYADAREALLAATGHQAAIAV